MNMKRICGLLALIAAPLTALAQSETLNYAATITGGSGIFASDTGTIGGTYTFNYSNADPTLSSGTVGSSQGWASYSSGAYVFTNAAFSTSSGNNVSYSDGPPGALADQTLVLATPGGGLSFSSYNQQQSDPNNFTLSVLGIVSAGTPWNSSGLPVLAAGDQGQGAIEVDVNGVLSELDYTVTSLKIAPLAAPEISAGQTASSITLLLGALCVLRARRSARPA